MIVVSAATAAPLQGELAASAATTSATHDGVPGVPGVPGVTDPRTRPPSASQTVDMLIDLQPRSAGLSFNERSPAGERAMRLDAPRNERGAVLPHGGADVAGQRPAAVPMAATSGLFGTGATPQVTSQQRMPGAGSHAPGGATRASGQAPSGEAPSPSAASAELPVWLRWPREVIVLVREHRDWVIGGIVAILAVSGAMSIVFGRQRRP